MSTSTSKTTIGSWWLSKQNYAGSTTTANPAAASTTTTTTTAPVAAGFANLFGAKPSANNQNNQPQSAQKPSLSSQAVFDILKGLKVEGSPEKYETAVIYVRSNNKQLGSDDSRLVGLRWFRAAEGGRFDELHFDKPFFQPSVDDVDNRLCVQCFDLNDETSSSFAEYGPVKLDPMVSQAVLNPETKIKASSDGFDYTVERTQVAPNPFCLKRSDDPTIEEPIVSWNIVANDPCKVKLGNGKELEFHSAFDRDVATLQVRTTLLAHKDATPGSGHSRQGSVDRKREIDGEKALRDRIMELEAQVMALRAKGGAAETGKALAEAQSLRRELEKAKNENNNLNDQITTMTDQISSLEEKCRNFEQSLAIHVAKEAALSSLQKEHDSMKESLEKSKSHVKREKERAEKAELALDELDRAVPELETRAKVAEQRVKVLEAQLAQAHMEAERAVGRKNAALQKADSLAKDMARMMKATPGGLEEVEATMRENHILKEKMEELRTELKQTRAAYEAQLAAGKVHSAKAVTTSLSSGNTSSVVKKAGQLEYLANSLMSEVKEKDEIIESLKSENEILKLRLVEYQKRNKDRSGSLSN